MGKAVKWTWGKLAEKQADMSDKELDKAIGSMWPKNREFNRVVAKLDSGEDLTEAEELILEKWENSQESGPAGKIMGGF